MYGHRALDQAACSNLFTPHNQPFVKMWYLPHFRDDNVEAQRYEGLQPRSLKEGRLNSPAVPGREHKDLQTKIP